MDQQKPAFFQYRNRVVYIPRWITELWGNLGMTSTRIKHLMTAITLMTVASVVHAGELTVSAAASLTNAFKEIASRYETQYPDTQIRLNFAASGALLQQIDKGAPVDVFASADQETMDRAEKRGLVDKTERHNFARNTLVVIVPSDSQHGINQLGDLTQLAVQKIAIGNPASVPVGRYTQQALESAGLWQTVMPKLINTQSVRQALDYVARGEVDAGFVYGTDAAIMKEKVKVTLTVPLDTVISYPIAKIARSHHGEEARRFINFVLSPTGQVVLRQYGFQQP